MDGDDGASGLQSFPNQQPPAHFRYTPMGKSTRNMENFFGGKIIGGKSQLPHLIQGSFP
jgi:hypothetical protein